MRHDPTEKGLGFRVQKLYAALVIHADGDEAVPAIRGGNGQWFPLFAADPARLESITAMAQELADYGDKKIVIAEFSIRRDVTTCVPAKRQ